jgi:hypothetical protein
MRRYEVEQFDHACRVCRRIAAIRPARRGTLIAEINYGDGYFVRCETAFAEALYCSRGDIARKAVELFRSSEYGFLGRRRKRGRRNE